MAKLKFYGNFLTKMQSSVTILSTPRNDWDKPLRASADLPPCGGAWSLPCCPWKGKWREAPKGFPLIPTPNAVSGERILSE